MARRQAWKTHLGTALFAAALSTQALAADPVLSFSVSTPSPAVAGSPVALDVLIAGIDGLYGYQFSIAFDPSILQATSVTEGAFLASGGTTFFSGGMVDNTSGTISGIFDTLIGPVPGVSGSGVLAHLVFNTIGAGSSALTFSDTGFVNAALADIPLQVSNGSVSAVPEPASYALLGLGLAGIAAVSRRRQPA